MPEFDLSRFYSARQSDYTRERVTLRAMITQIQRGTERHGRDGTIASVIEGLRALAAEERAARDAGDERLADALAQQRGFEKSIMLPAVTPAGVVVGNRNAADGAYVRHSGLVVLDFDHIDEPAEVRDEIMGSKRSAACAFVSPSGDGVKVFVVVDPLPETPWEHEAAYDAVVRRYRSLDLEVDPSGRDVSRLCFYSLDPEARIRKEGWRPRPVPWEAGDAPAPPAEPEQRPGRQATSYRVNGTPSSAAVDVPSMLAAIPADDREVWLRVGMALHEDGQPFEIWRDWSATSVKYDERDTEYTWRRFKGGKGVTMGTVWHLAREHGWQRPGEGGPAMLPEASPEPATSAFECSRCKGPADRYSSTGEPLCGSCGEAPISP